MHMGVNQLEVLLHQVVRRVLIRGQRLRLLATGVGRLLRLLGAEIHGFEQAGRVQTGPAIRSYESVSVPLLRRLLRLIRKVARVVVDVVRRINCELADLNASV